MRRDIYLQVHIEAFDDLAFYAMCGLGNCGVSMWVGITAWPVIQPFPADVLVHSSLILEEFTKEKSRVASQHHKSLLYKTLYFRELRG